MALRIYMDRVVMFGNVGAWRYYVWIMLDNDNVRAEYTRCLDVMCCVRVYIAPLQLQICLLFLVICMTTLSIGAHAQS